MRVGVGRDSVYLALESAGRWQSICRDCRRLQSHEHYERHIDAVRAKASVSKKRAREEAERFIYEYLSYQTCLDCGEYDFSVLTFDSRAGKEKDGHLIHGIARIFH